MLVFLRHILVQKRRNTDLFGLLPAPRFRPRIVLGEFVYVNVSARYFRVVLQIPDAQT